MNCRLAASGAGRDPDHPEHEELVDWIDGAFDPEAFDLRTVDGPLKRLE